ncbi:hypothetical protein SEA_PHRANN_47 [Mycobacterium phage Phrann]|uniref:Uncharacterized protein n=8 Tax=Charlievirus TaxID=1623280 RepID=A0A1I9SCA1_9CAUD|nr:hypothetical protein CL59_gp50 [Mycobacterium phage Redi]YP_009304239.1 hypothetical protein BJD68_gp47 [Mycobacterium phage Phrann]YP_010052249.1 hypothetical protein KD933_gp42 [Mycobacterium phage Rebel]AOZ64478.1 hypothetical protein SEA_PHANCYPHIN_50 [Mycobacterium phage PhancyPhin]QAY16033.1 hypothetical protein SEA_BABERUTH_51 [Mycobacterium phage BabeRuth]QBI99178.1 hypothetical protein SEA_NENAE_50 [Mycobacterium phage Nenae]QBI99248.1 hypothetical protein SEA_PURGAMENSTRIS_50 [My
MTRALLVAAWVFGVIAWAAFVLLWRELFVVAGIASAAATLAWGFRQQPDPDDWSTDEWWIERETDVAYEWETDEWRRATHTMSETERAAAVGAHRHGLGVIGDRDDARDEIGGAR